MNDRIRSIIFNFLFYVILTPGVCIITMPALLSRRATLAVARFYQRANYFLEKHVMNLDFEVRNAHLIPEGGQFIAAIKHQSAYETMKLLFLFEDPTIILKRELLRIPIFGWFLKKLEVIDIDRSNREDSLRSLREGAQKMKDNHRPIVIFPQGTRVSADATTKERPYKGGIMKLYSATNMPIIPIALNTGVYWPRNSFWKKSGKVIFEVLPSIPAGLDSGQVMKALEETIEPASKKLVEEARQVLKA